MSQAIQRLDVVNAVHVFHNGQEALAYLKATPEQPFLILPHRRTGDINMPLLNGLELRAEINQNAYLRRKSVPFVFLTTTASPEAIQEAYDESVQGFYQKATSQVGLEQQLKLIFDYWQSCLHPNNIV